MYMNNSSTSVVQGHVSVVSNAVHAVRGVGALSGRCETFVERDRMSLNCVRNLRMVGSRSFSLRCSRKRKSFRIIRTVMKMQLLASSVSVLKQSHRSNQVPVCVQVVKIRIRTQVNGAHDGALSTK